MGTTTEIEYVQSLAKEQERLRARVANLEVALHGMWAMLQPLQPPATQEDVSRMMQEHFEAMQDMGVVRLGQPTFERA